LDLLGRHPNGLRYSELVRLLHETFPTIPQNTIQGSMWNLDALFPEAVYKPAKGVSKATAFREGENQHDIISVEQQVTPPEISFREERFYKPFADWISKELEECTKAVPLGGNRFKDKWGTPDVVGIREPKKSDIIKPTTEIVPAEIKIDKSGLIIAFGQACAYKLYSHRSYIVVPVESQEEDIARLDVLCRTLGVGLILFDATNPTTPHFEIRVRAAKHEPDMFYVNKYMKLVEEELFS
jgi:hypothetical protein